jgi:hypothetical protein
MKYLSFLLVLVAAPLAAQSVGTVLVLCGAQPQRITQLRLLAGGDSVPLSVRDSLGLVRVADVTWSSNNGARVAVDSRGIIWPLQPGSATITATVPASLGVKVNLFSVRVYSGTQDMSLPAPSVGDCGTRALRLSP